MNSPRSDTAIKRAKRWNLDVRHALYRKTGDWYHKLERFPGALLDENGYVVFETEEAFYSCSELRIRKDVSAPDGINVIPGYTIVVGAAEEGFVPKSYEQAIAIEGARVDVIQTRRERDPVARATCLRLHGYSCAACGLDFESQYGPIGRRFIHVHHLDPLAGGERQVDPAVDLVPLCPNCHAMAHRRIRPYSVEELKELLGAHGGPKVPSSPNGADAPVAPLMSPRPAAHSQR